MPKLLRNVRPQLLADPGPGLLSDVAKELARYAIEPKVDGIRCRLVYTGETDRGPLSNVSQVGKRDPYVRVRRRRWQ